MTTRYLAALGTALALLLTTACSGSGGDALLGTDSAIFEPFGENGEMPVLEGLTLGADPEKIALDPCNPDAPADPDTGKLLGKTTIGAFVRDAELQPVVGVEVTFVSSAGILESMGQPVLTDDRGLATDVLAVDEDDVGQIIVTVTTTDFEESITVPVNLLPETPLTLAMNPAELWPPNHKMKEVTAVFDGLECDPETTFQLVSVTSNEPDNGTGDGNTVDDIQDYELGDDDTVLMLRAERSGSGDGRVYTVTYDVTNGAGEVSTMSATVTVPHDQG